MSKSPSWIKGCLLWVGLIVVGWGIILAIGLAILKGITTLLSLYED